MPTQHLLLASDGNDRIIDADTLEDELVITPPLHTSAGNVIPNTDHHRVAVKKHYCRGKIYAVALDRHAASNEIDDAIDLHHPEPIEQKRSQSLVKAGLRKWRIRKMFW